MKSNVMSLIVALGVLLAACAAPAAPPTMPTQPPTVMLTPAPSMVPTPTPSDTGTVKPGGGLITRPQADVWSTAPDAALKARADLVKRLGIDPDLVQLVSVEHVDWPDGCMGIHSPGVMCTMVIIPGYRVVLEVNGTQYEYHTNEDGSVVRLVGG